jgi:NAD(P)-dependent dehydrogenase (short-subunit alcohol dehydrogenase family)
MEPSKLQVHIEAAVATLTLNRPEVLNAIDGETWVAIGRAMREAENHPEVRVVVVTGGGGGIGGALCRRFAVEGARAVVVADLDHASAARVATEVGGLPWVADVTVEADVHDLVARVVEAHGRIDIYCSNAGIAIRGGPEAPDSGWQQSWMVNTLAHVYAARAVLPGMLARGEGYLVGTISAAGLLNHVTAAPYAVTKAAALSLFEWLAIAHHDQGIRVSVVCPQGTDPACCRRKASARSGRGSGLL